MKMKLRKLLAEFDVRERAAAITVVILVWLGLNLAFTFLVNVPRARRARALEDEVARIAGQTTAKQRAIARLRPHFARVVEGNTSLDTFYADVLSTKQERLISFQKEIRDIATKFNINMEAISYPRESYPEHRVTKLSAVMPLAGSYENLRSFVDTIEKSDNFIIIDSIQLASSKEGGVILSLNIVLSTYFIDPDIPQEAVAGRRRRG